MEQGNAYNAMNFGVKDSAVGNTTVCGTLIATFVCPSDARTVAFNDAGTVFGGTNYGSNDGDWYVFSLPNGTQSWSGMNSRGAFSHNVGRRIADFTDGTSSTILFGEIKSFQFRLKCASLTAEIGSPSTIPATNAALPAEYTGGGTCSAPSTTMHTRWSNGGVYHSGFTTAWTPNKKTMFNYSGTPALTPSVGVGAVDADLISINENDGGPTFGAFTSRSYHPGGVNQLFADGSVRFIKDAVDGPTYRALGTPGGGEVTSADAY